MKEFCIWCSKDVEVPDTFDRNKNTAACSGTCRCLEFLFRAAYSDEEYNRRQHYNELTKGTDE